MIYINGRFLTQPMTGVERYAYNMCKALAELGQSFAIVCPHKPIQSCYDTSLFNIVHYGFGNSHFWEQCVLPFFFLNKKDYIVISFTGLGSIFIRPKIMTIHDLAFLKNPSWYSKTYYLYYKLMTPLAVKTSKQIITVSNFSKEEILYFYPFLKSDQISVLYNAIDQHLFKKLSDIQLPQERFALCVSSIDPRKNFARLIEAYKDINDIKLFIIGNYNKVFREQELSNSISNNIRFLGRVSDEELVKLYNQAECFIFPTLYEGFGLPPLEAMACGCPVIVSDIPVEREICGDAAIYFNPLCINDIHDTITQYLEKTSVIKEEICPKGHANTMRFSWEKSAKRVVGILERIIADEENSTPDC